MLSDYGLDALTISQFFLIGWVSVMFPYLAAFSFSSIKTALTRI